MIIQGVSKEKKLKVNVQHLKQDNSLLHILNNLERIQLVQRKGHVILNKSSADENKVNAFLNRISGFGKVSQKTSTTRCLYYYNLLNQNSTFYPKTYIWPDEYNSFVRTMDPKKLYIIKPSNGSEGKGIFMFKSLQDLILQIGNGSTFYILQEYIEPLLINELKFDLRFYIVITNLNPYQCYLHKEGLVRFCTQKHNIQDKFGFLTNYSINFSSETFKQSNEQFYDDLLATKQTFNALRKHLKQKNMDDLQIFNDIEIIIAEYVKSIYPFLLYYNQSQLNKNQFGFLGLDIMLDSSGIPYLLEANSAPSWNIYQSINGKQEISPIDYYVKSNVIGDALKLVENMKFNRNIEVEGYINLTEKYQLGQYLLIDLLRIFQSLGQHARNKNKILFLNCSQFCKLSQFPIQKQLRSGQCSQVYHQIIKTSYYQTEMDFDSFIRGLILLAGQQQKQFNEFIQQLISQF